MSGFDSKSAEQMAFKLPASSRQLRLNGQVWNTLPRSEDLPEGTRHCSSCRKTKPLEEFGGKRTCTVCLPLKRNKRAQQRLQQEAQQAENQALERILRSENVRMARTVLRLGSVYSHQKYEIDRLCAYIADRDPNFIKVMYATPIHRLMRVVFFCTLRLPLDAVCAM